MTGDHYLQNTMNAIMFVVDFSVKDKYTVTNVHFKDIKVDGTSVVSARVGGSATFQDVKARNVGAAGINNCGNFDWGSPNQYFNLIDLGGNEGWMGTPVCDDRPPVVPPPPPSPW